MGVEAFYAAATHTLFALVGLCVGSFLNVAAYRLPLGLRLSKPSSHCPQCKRRLAWRDLIPLLSYIFLGGKCRYCGKRIPFRYFFVELINGMLWLACSLTLYESNGIAAALIFALTLSTLLCMAICDAEHMMIPDSLQVSLLLFALAGAFLAPTPAWTHRLYGAMLGGGFFLFFYFLSPVLFGREGLGLADVKLMAIAGIFLGAASTALTIVIGTVSALAGVCMREAAGAGQRRLPLFDGDKEFAFAPGLILGIVTAAVYGEQIWSAYRSMFAGF